MRLEKQFTHSISNHYSNYIFKKSNKEMSLFFFNCYKLFLLYIKKHHAIHPAWHDKVYVVMRA
jgi:hypothetical protein